MARKQATETWTRSTAKTNADVGTVSCVYVERARERDRSKVSEATL